MGKKIVAIGGGENGHKRADGTYTPYETEKIDKEIIRLTNKDNPNFLLIAHSQLNPEFEQRYFDTMKRIYADKFGCECRWLTRNELISNFDKAVNDVEWADIIYEGGGDTKAMVELWESTGFDKILRQAWQKGKVVCGVSAGANCWFRYCSSDSLKIQSNDDNAPMITLECLDFVPAFFTPHCNEKGRLEHTKAALRNLDTVALAVSNCAALEIVDDKYRLITCDASNYGIDAYAIKSYWKNNKYHTEYIDDSDEFKNVFELLDISPLTHKGTQVIKTERLTLRPVKADDYKDMYKFTSKEEVAKYVSWSVHKSIDDTKALCEMWAGEYKNGDRYNWAIVYDNTVIGNIDVVKIVGTTAFLDWQIDSDYWNQGIVTEAALAVRDYLFSQIGVTAIEATHIDRNIGSGRVKQAR